MFKLKALHAVGLAACLTLAACGQLSNREDFASGLKDKTPEQVLSFAGKPQSESAAGQGSVWVYKSRTFDVTTRVTDPQTTVIFAPADDGKLHVAQVKFE